MSLSTISVNLVANIAGFTSDLGRAERESRKRFDSIKRQAGVLGKQLGVALAGAAAEVSRGVLSATRQMDEIYKSAQKIGTSTESLAGLGFAAEQSGSSLEGMSRAAAILSRNLAAAAGGGEAQAAVFAAMGLSITDASGKLRPFDAILGEVADKFAGYEDGAAKAALAQRLFGRSGTDLIPLLNAGSQGIGELKEQAERLGVTFGETAGKQAEVFNDNLSALQTGVGGLYQGIAEALLPSLVETTGALVQQAEAANTAGGSFAILGDAVKVVVAIVGTLKNVVETGVDLLLALADAAFGVGNTIKGVFLDVGRDLGAFAAAFDALKSGQLTLAFDILKERAADTGSATKEGLDQIRAAWDNFSSGLANNQQDVTDLFTSLFAPLDEAVLKTEGVAAATRKSQPPIVALAAATTTLGKASKQSSQDMDGHVRAMEKMNAAAEELADDIISDLTARFDEGRAINEDYAATVAALTPLLAQGGTVAAKAAEAIRLAARARNEDLKALKAAQDPYAELVQNMRDEIALVKMSRADREAEVALRWAGAEATDEQRAALKALMLELARQEEVAQAAEDWENLWLDAIGNVADALTEALTGSGTSLAEGLESALSSFAEQWNRIQSDQLSSGLRNMAQNGFTPENTQQVGGALVTMGAQYIGTQLGGGGQRAALGSSIGSAIGTAIAGPVGAVVGSILGGLVGGAFDDDPYVRVSGQSFRGSEARVSSPFGDIFTRTSDMDARARDVANAVADFDRAMAGLLDGDEVTRVAEAMRAFNVKLEDASVDMEEILNRRLSLIIDTIAPQWAAFLDGFSSVEERSAQFQSLRAISDYLEDFGDVLARVSMDPMVQLVNQLENLNEAVDDAQTAYARALDSQDAVEISKTVAELEDAIISRYETEVALVRGLQQAIRDAQDQLRDFRAGIAQRLQDLGEDVTAIVQQLRDGLGGLQNEVLTAPDTVTALANLDRFVNAVDQWLSAERSRIEAWANAARNAVQTQLAALDGEAAAIMAAAQARAEAAAYWGQQAAEAAAAARQAELEALQQQLAIAEQWAGLLSNLQQQLDQLRFSSSNPASTLERLGLVNQRIADVQRRFNESGGTDATLASELSALLNQRLQLAQQAFQRPSPEYLAVFRDTEQQLIRLRDIAQTEAQRAEALQERIAELSAQNVSATAGVTDAMYFLSAEERQRLDEIEERRTELNEELLEINEEEARLLGEVNTQARAYYTWAREQGELLNEQRQTELLDALNAVTGGLDPESFLAARAAETVALLEELRDGLYAFLDEIEVDVGVGGGDGGIVPDPGGGGGGGGSGAAVITLGDINITTTTTDPVVMARTVVKAIQDNVRTVANTLKPALRQSGA